jgi:hypothetical protein
VEPGKRTFLSETGIIFPPKFGLLAMWNLTVVTDMIPTRALEKYSDGDL